MNEKLKVLDLFSGIGGFSLGLERTGGFETVAFCEIDKWAQKVLKKHWPEVPIYEDVRNLEHDGAIDVITGGFPCQDISRAGHQKGLAGERSGLWADMLRHISNFRPEFAIVENVANLLAGPGERRGGWFSTILADLAAIGYDAEWHCIQPNHVGIPSIRDRVWICAYPAQKYVAEMVVKGRLSFEYRGMGADHLSEAKWSVDICGMGRGVDGVPDRTYRFAQLGNAVVPQIPEMIGYAILEAMEVDNE